ncbi:hypothetical protein KR018_006891 [Drosophila ironensis]|nr:hypothetical protein KR018_006891 [Drosophila ironensis]
MDSGDELPLEDEEAEVARLKLPPKRQSPPPRDDDATIEFRCSTCDMREMVHYFGRKPPFALAICYAEDNYVMRDPFQPPPPRHQKRAEYYISLGAKCAACSKIVCRDSACSYFYTATFCTDCAKAKLKEWPVEAQTRFRKQLASSESKD